MFLSIVPPLDIYNTQHTVETNLDWTAENYGYTSKEDRPRYTTGNKKDYESQINNRIKN